MSGAIFFDYSKGVNKVFARFKELYPYMVRRGMNYEPYDYMTIKISIPGVGKAIYNYHNDKITWLEHWVDEKEIERQEKEMRPDMYEEFCAIIKNYMEQHEMTQQEFSDLVGISRRSISKYLNGDRIPKVSTMRDICKSINIEL